MEQQHVGFAVENTGTHTLGVIHDGVKAPIVFTSHA
jgi:hypothetical protein